MNVFHVAFSKGKVGAASISLGTDSGCFLLKNCSSESGRGISEPPMWNCLPTLTVYSPNHRFSPQGLVLSCILFNIYVKPLRDVIRRLRLWCQKYTYGIQFYLSFPPNSEDDVDALSQCLKPVMY